MDNFIQYFEQLSPDYKELWTLGLNTFVVFSFFCIKNYGTLLVHHVHMTQLFFSILTVAKFLY